MVSVTIKVGNLTQYPIIGRLFYAVHVKMWISKGSLNVVDTASTLPLAKFGWLVISVYLLSLLVSHLCNTFKRQLVVMGG